MQSSTIQNPPKKATNLSINRELLAQAKALNINLSATLEQALEDKVRQAQREQWLKSNKDALEACNQLADKNGLFSDDHRVL